MKPLYKQIDKILTKHKSDAPNIYRILDNAKYEKTHSNFLGWLLNPKENHLQGSLFVKLFFEELLSIDGAHELDVLKEFDPLKAHVSLERKIKSDGKIGFVDIIIEDDKSFILIENKLYSHDHSDQLKRYQKYAKETNKEYIFFYLTRFGTDPIEQSAQGVDVQKIDYMRFMTYFIRSCLHNCKNNEVTKKIEEYFQTIQKITYTFHNSTDIKNELLDLLTTEEHLNYLHTLLVQERTDVELLSDEEFEIEMMLLNFSDEVCAYYELKFWQYLSKKLEENIDYKVIDSWNDDSGELDNTTDFIVKYGYHYGNAVGVKYYLDGIEYQINNDREKIYLLPDAGREKTLLNYDPFSQSNLKFFTQEYALQIANQVLKKIKDK